MNRFAIVAAVCALSSVTATAAPRDRNAVPSATPIGKDVGCVTLNQIRSTRVHGDSTIDFHMTGGRVLRNTLPNSCPSLGFEERFAYKTSIGQLCSVDIITVLRSPDLSPGASCGLGRFQPVTLDDARRR